MLLLLMLLLLLLLMLLLQLTVRLKDCRLGMKSCLRKKILIVQLRLLPLLHGLAFLLLRLYNSCGKKIGNPVNFCDYMAFTFIKFALSYLSPQIHCLC